MLLHARDCAGRVVDLDTGRAVPRVIWLDLDRSELEAYAVDGQGRCVAVPGEPGKWRTYRARGRFRFDPEGGGSPLFTRNAHVLPPRPAKIVMGAESCALCNSPLTLPGDDLCPPCRAKQQGQRNRMAVERIATPFLDRPCCAKGCGRLAAWSVSDEVIVTPGHGIALVLPSGQTLKRPLFERGMCVGRHWYCDRHYQAPRVLDSKGNVVEVLHDAGGVRPQW